MSTEKLDPETTYQSVIGQVIVTLRKEQSIEQATMASAVGVTQSTWSRIERGESSLTVDQLATASAKLRLSASAILKKAEDAIDELKLKGVIVASSKSSATNRKSTSGAAILGAAALGALVGASMANASKKEK